jgi:signal transduction histidine kinase
MNSHVNSAHDAILELKEKWIEVSVKLNLESLLITISDRDSGSGIPEELAEKILAPFFTAKEIGKGTGLGLSVSKEIVEVHSGKFGLVNDDEHTHFFFTIPLKQKKIDALKAALLKE